jgi:hypothetical protein
MRSLLCLLLYVLVVIPLGMLSRMFRDPLGLRPDPRAQSYWTTFPGA